jgi:beta-alanine degradation protein BauB
MTGHGTSVPEATSMWSSELREECTGGRRNGRVGQVLLHETSEVRVWSLSLSPGERFGFHCHQLNYFWTALCEGRSISRYSDGKVLETTYFKGMTKSFSFGKEERLVHDLTNAGETVLEFITVEFLNSANAPLPLG